MKTNVRIALADDHKLFREALRMLINTEPCFQIVGEAENGLSAIEQVREHSPDIVLMDVKMPVMNGIDATRLITLRFPHTKVIALSLADDPPTTEKMRIAGAISYLTKLCSRKDLVDTIYQAHNDSVFLTFLSNNN